MSGIDLSVSGATILDRPFESASQKARPNATRRIVLLRIALATSNFSPLSISSDGPARHHGSDGDDQPGGQADPTDGAIVFDVVFSEPVFGFAAGDVLLSGTAGATTATRQRVGDDLYCHRERHDG
jgi:hypothetical protein